LYSPGAHSDVAQIIGGTNVVLRRCRLEAATDNINAALQMGGFTGGASSVGPFLVEDTFFNGGGYILSGGQPVGANGPFTFRRNRFGTSYNFGPTYPGLTTSADWDNTNVDDATGVPV
jgi:hypothetical protein